LRHCHFSEGNSVSPGNRFRPLQAEKSEEYR